MNPTMDAIYLLSPQPHIVDCVMADFEKRRYRRAYLVWTGVLDPQLRRRIDTSAQAQQQLAGKFTCGLLVRCVQLTTCRRFRNPHHRLLPARISLNHLSRSLELPYPIPPSMQPSCPGPYADFSTASKSRLAPQNGGRRCTVTYFCAIDYRHLRVVGRIS